jgi:hypothetical protein
MSDAELCSLDACGRFDLFLAGQERHLAEL